MERKVALRIFAHWARMLIKRAFSYAEPFTDLINR